MGRGSSKVSGGGGGFKLITDAREISPSVGDIYFDGSLDNLTKNERDALNWYTGSAYIKYNKALRSGDTGPNSHPNRTKSIDSAIAKGELYEPIKVYRESSPDLLGFSSTPSMEQLQALVGGEFHDPAPVSTSISKSTIFDGMINYEITVPAGKGRGQYVRPISQHKGEYEYLLARNSKFRVTGVTGNSWKPIVQLQVID